MKLKLAATPLCQSPQLLTFEKIATLIGKNGSGKSSILKAIFDTKMNRQDFNDLRIVCFSSGQNESFSEPFTKYLHKEREIEKPINLSCFYYDKLLSKLLIFLATSSFSEGLVRNFLRKHEYIEEKVVAGTQKDDISSTLTIRLTVPRKYVERVQKAYEDEEEGGKSTLRSTPFYRALESFITTNVEETFDFSEPLPPTTVVLTANSILNTSFIPALPEMPGDENQDSEHRSDDNPTVRFFTQAADDDYFIDRSKMTLTLRDKLELDQLSDGEYQLLFIYALIDLFDSPKTLFLLDEADSHLHYRNIARLWRTFNHISGKVITTTHLLDSITANNFDDIKVIDNGEVSEHHKLKQVIGRLEIISNASTKEFEVCSKVKHIVLIDNCNDWEIFKQLARRKGLNINAIECVHPLQKTSSYKDTNENFAKAKFQWVDELVKVKDLQTSRIFLICDRDEAPLNFDAVTGVKVTGREYNERVNGLSKPPERRVFLLAWKRREIKNYLLSYTALENFGALNSVNNDSLPRIDYLTPNDPGDNDSIRALSAKDAVDKFINRDGFGLSSEMLNKYINLIPRSEISEDIENMYNFIVSNLK